MYARSALTDAICAADWASKGLRRGCSEIRVDSGEEFGVRVGPGQRDPDLAEGDLDQGTDLEELEPDGADLGLGEFGALQAFAT